MDVKKKKKKKIQLYWHCINQIPYSKSILGIQIKVVFHYMEVHESANKFHLLHMFLAVLLLSVCFMYISIQTKSPSLRSIPSLIQVQFKSDIEVILAKRISAQTMCVKWTTYSTMLALN